MKPRHSALQLLLNVVSCCLIFQGCSREKEPASNEFSAEAAQAAGFRKAVRTGAMVAKAMALSNQVLATVSNPTNAPYGFRLVDGWQDKTLRNIPGKDVPLFLIHAPPHTTSPDLTLAWIRVPEGRVAIIIDEEPMDVAINGEKASGSDTTLAIKGEERLAVMLLHEMGHIVNGDYGAFAEAVPNELASYNLDQNIDKSREFLADAFAARTINSAMKAPSDEFDRRMAAISLSLCLSSWSFNLTKERLLDNFGATTLNRPSVFWDKGNSHPNTELRVLVIQHLLMGTENSAALLDSFLAHRRSVSSEPRIPWRKSDP